MNPGMKKSTGGLKRKPFLTPVWLAGLLVLALVVIAEAGWRWISAGPTTVIVVRHAEKVLDGQPDPPLSGAGEARAALLARMFGQAGSADRLTAIYVSPLTRSRMTAAPLAAALGLTPVVVPADDPQGLARRILRDQAGGRVLVVGHADTIPAVLAALGAGGTPEAIADTQYGRMYVVTIPRVGRVNVLRIDY